MYSYKMLYGQLLLIDKIIRGFYFSKGGDRSEMDTNGTTRFIGSAASGQKHFILHHKAAIQGT